MESSRGIPTLDAQCSQNGLIEHVRTQSARGPVKEGALHVPHAAEHPGFEGNKRGVFDDRARRSLVRYASKAETMRRPRAG